MRLIIVDNIFICYKCYNKIKKMDKFIIQNINEIYNNKLILYNFIKKIFKELDYYKLNDFDQHYYQIIDIYYYYVDI